MEGRKALSNAEGSRAGLQEQHKAGQKQASKQNAPVVQAIPKQKKKNRKYEISVTRIYRKSTQRTPTGER
jgi:hypothetical protein